MSPKSKDWVEGAEVGSHIRKEVEGKALLEAGGGPAAGRRRALLEAGGGPCCRQEETLLQAGDPAGGWRQKEGCAGGVLPFSQAFGFGFSRNCTPLMNTAKMDTNPSTNPEPAHLPLTRLSPIH